MRGLHDCRSKGTQAGAIRKWRPQNARARQINCNDSEAKQVARAQRESDATLNTCEPSRVEIAAKVLCGRENRYNIVQNDRRVCDQRAVGKQERGIAAAEAGEKSYSQLRLAALRVD